MAKGDPIFGPCTAGCSQGMIQRQVMALRKGKDGKDESYTTWENDECRTCDGSGRVVVGRES